MTVINIVVIVAITDGVMVEVAVTVVVFAKSYWRCCCYCVVVVGD